MLSSLGCGMSFHERFLDPTKGFEQIEGCFVRIKETLYQIRVVGEFRQYRKLFAKGLETVVDVPLTTWAWQRPILLGWRIDNRHRYGLHVAQSEYGERIRKQNLGRPFRLCYQRTSNLLSADKFTQRASVEDLLRSGRLNRERAMKLQWPREAVYYQVTAKIPVNRVVANRYETKGDRLVVFISFHAIFHPRIDQDVPFEKLERQDSFDRLLAIRSVRPAFADHSEYWLQLIQSAKFTKARTGCSTFVQHHDYTRDS